MSETRHRVADRAVWVVGGVLVVGFIALATWAAADGELFSVAGFASFAVIFGSVTTADYLRCATRDHSERDRP